MYQIDYSKFKEKSLSNVQSDIISSLTLPLGIDPLQYNIKRHDNYPKVINKIRRYQESQLEEKMYCFYCGEPDPIFFPGFLHNGSGTNVWMYASIACGSMICKQCNIIAGKSNLNYKRKFSNVTKYKTHEVLKFEPNILIPNLEPVHLHFKYCEDGLLEPLTIRASTTINMFSLNREQLVSRRLESIRYYKKSFGAPLSERILSPIDLLFCYHNESSEKYNSNPDHLSMIKCYKMIHEDNKIYSNGSFQGIPYKGITFKKLLSNNNTNLKGIPKANFLGVDSIEFDGIRGFSGKQNVNFNGKNSLIIIGENGVGKSTLLQLISKSLKVGSPLSMRNLVNEIEVEPFFKIKYNRINQYYKYEEITKKKYGRRSSCNLIEIGESRVSPSIVYNLVNWINSNKEDEELISWTARQLKTLLNIDEESELKITDENPHWYNRKSSPKVLHLEHMSSGYRSIMSIFYAILKKLTPSENLEYSKLITLHDSLSSTVVLIDEIELHLHPVFKKEIIKRLQEVFPEVLFIMTTHDPLVLKSATNNTDVILLDRNRESNKTEIRSNLPNHTQMSTEQILTSPIFGLATISSCREKQEKIERYQYALKSENWEAVNQLRSELYDVGLFGNTYREFLALSAVDAYLSKKKIPSTSEIMQFLMRSEGDSNA
ncbi:AAA family ATPase [Vibrio campbellii]|uniref:AAA family ATPase n=1 Tax=Vibrio campbellii TaxID=680 RepID=UPI0003A03D98|nr:AAA family ATPase [Vibrio campbellii]